MSEPISCHKMVHAAHDALKAHSNPDLRAVRSEVFRVNGVLLETDATARLLVQPLQAGDVAGHEFHGNQWTTSNVSTGENYSHPMRYVQFKSAGNKDSDWEKYAAEQNAASKSKAQTAIKQKWESGEKVSGNDIANHIRQKGISIPESLSKGLQHDDTKVSKETVAGRGMGRSEAAKIHKFVSLSMLDEVQGRNALEAGDIVGHEFRGNQWTEGKDFYLERYQKNAVDAGTHKVVTVSADKAYGTEYK